MTWTKYNALGLPVTAEYTPSLNLTSTTINTEVLLEKTTLGGSGSFDIDFTSISDGLTCDHLRIVIRARGSVAADTDVVYAFLNNDTTLGNYYRQRMGALAAASVNDLATAPFVGNVSASTAEADNFSTIELFIPDYRSSTKKKLMRSINTQYASTTVMRAALLAVNWNSTASINRLQIRTDNHPTDLFLINSEIWVYGQKSISVLTNVTIS